MSVSGIRPWVCRATTLLLDRSPWFRVFQDEVELPSGRVIPDFLRIEGRDYAIVFALTDDQQVLCERQYKHGSGKIIVQLPAGYVEEGETPEECAQRELLEETGYVAAAWQHLGSYVVDSNRGFGEAHVFLARGVRPVMQPPVDELEPLETFLVPLEEATRMTHDGQVTELAIVTALSLGLLALQRD